jgi:hypothetical protein
MEDFFLGTDAHKVVPTDRLFTALSRVRSHTIAVKGRHMYVGVVDFLHATPTPTYLSRHSALVGWLPKRGHTYMSGDGHGERELSSPPCTYMIE